MNANISSPAQYHGRRQKLRMPYIIYRSMLIKSPTPKPAVFLNALSFIFPFKRLNVSHIGEATTAQKINHGSSAMLAAVRPARLSAGCFFPKENMEMPALRLALSNALTFSSRALKPSGSAAFMSAIFWAIVRLRIIFSWRLPHLHSRAAIILSKVQDDARFSSSGRYVICSLILEYNSFLRGSIS